jgi:hypothetical protein
MTNDGGPIPDNQTRAGPVLCQRAFIFDVMARSIPIALLHGATFRDSKVDYILPPFSKLLTQFTNRLSHSSLSKDYSLTLGRF